ncbi:MAG: hypothetical protein AB1479_08920 [Pseudomonadota bacterium]
MNARTLRILSLSALLAAASTALTLYWQDALEHMMKPHWSSHPPELSDAPMSGIAPTNLSSLTSTRNRPLFWESRRPPEKPALAEESSSGPIELLGIITEHDDRIALARIGGKSAQPTLRLRKGQLIGRFAVMRIDADSITLSSKDGVTQTLKLKRGNTPLNAQPRPATR